MTRELCMCPWLVSHVRHDSFICIPRNASSLYALLESWIIHDSCFVRVSMTRQLCTSWLIHTYNSKRFKYVCAFRILGRPWLVPDVCVHDSSFLRHHSFIVYNPKRFECECAPRILGRRRLVSPVGFHDSSVICVMTHSYVYLEPLGVRMRS